tara:strand:- start:68 stop:379 length:312 start_codon:yes stop_codon:yes gene_type:complete
MPESSGLASALHVRNRNAARKACDADNRHKHKNTMNYQDKMNDALASPSASHWLKNALRALDSRDPIDALNDVESLWHFANDRVCELEPSCADIAASEAKIGA